MNQAREVADLVDRIHAAHPGARVSGDVGGPTLVRAEVAGRTVVLLGPGPGESLCWVGERIDGTRALSAPVGDVWETHPVALADSAAEFMDLLNAAARAAPVPRGRSAPGGGSSSTAGCGGGGDDEGDDADAIGDFYEVEREE